MKVIFQSLSQPFCLFLVQLEGSYISRVWEIESALQQSEAVTGLLTDLLLLILWSNHFNLLSKTTPHSPPFTQDTSTMYHYVGKLTVASCISLHYRAEHHQLTVFSVHSVWLHLSFILFKLNKARNMVFIIWTWVIKYSSFQLQKTKLHLWTQ